MTVFRTTPEERIEAARYAVELTESGLPARFADAVLQLANTDQGVFDLLALWAECKEPEERDQIVAELQEVIDEESELVAGPVQKPKIPFEDLEGVTESIAEFKKKLRDLIDQNGGVTEVARRSGIPQPSLSRMLSSVSMPRRTTLYRIANALNLPESAIVTEWVR